MKTKAAWRPIGHSASKWRESTHRRGIVLNTPLSRTARRKKRNKNPLAVS
jgi:hypothetical protein